ncbi:MAG: hypothetical protein J5737_05225 [Bacteroidales bacterium]|nr:hypothetical protein [Bacteroidales bacterium]
MKKSLILASVALLAMTVSCDLFKNTFKEQDVKVNETSNVAADEFIGLKDNKYASVNPQGDLTVEAPAEKSIIFAMDYAKPKSLVPESLVISGKDLPEISKPENGEAPEIAGILISVKNPADTPVEMEASLKVDAATMAALPPVIIPAGGETKILYSKDDINNNLPTLDNPDDIVVVPDMKANNFGKPFQSIEISGITFSPSKTKAAAPAGENGQIEINAKYCALLSFPKGTTITIHQTFHDLNVHLDRLSEYTFNKYAITLNVTNTLPFDILASAKNADGITAVADKAAKAGSTGNPVTSTVIVTVTDNSGKKVSDIETADLTLTLTAAVDGAKIPKDVKVTIDVDKITPLD